MEVVIVIVVVVVYLALSLSLSVGIQMSRWRCDDELATMLAAGDTGRRPIAASNCRIGLGRLIPGLVLTAGSGNSFGQLIRASWAS